VARFGRVVEQVVVAVVGRGLGQPEGSTAVGYDCIVIPPLPDLRDLRFPDLDTQATVDLQRDFRALLYSWNLRQVRGQVPPIPAPEPCPPDWQDRVELSHGDGHFTNRALLLKDTLGRLAKKRRVSWHRIAAALAEAQIEALIAAHHIRNEAATRWIGNEFRILNKAFPELLDRAATFFDRMHYDHAIVRDMRLLRDAWPGVPLVKVLQQGSVQERQRRRGHQPEPWLARAEDALRAAGVTAREDRHDLLAVAGLKPLPS
jgi:hypothetical protein